MKLEEAVQIDKNYEPRIGDMLFNDQHPFITIQEVYRLKKTSMRVNRNYNLELTKYELLEKIIQRKEAIWDQHKKDLKLFPENSSGDQTLDREQSIKYNSYLYHNDHQRYQRLYCSKYRSMPPKKIKVDIGYKAMVQVSHGLCKSVHQDYKYGELVKSCPNWYGLQSRPVSSLITQGFKYLGNVYQDLLETNTDDVHKAHIKRYYNED